MSVYQGSNQPCVVFRTHIQCLLASRVYIPRVRLFKCENCAERVKRKSFSDVHQATSHALHVVDRDNYLHLQNINEEVQQKSQMETLDIRINNRERKIRRESKAFS